MSNISPLNCVKYITTKLCQLLWWFSLYKSVFRKNEPDWLLFLEIGVTHWYHIFIVLSECNWLPILVTGIMHRYHLFALISIIWPVLSEANAFRYHKTACLYQYQCNIQHKYVIRHVALIYFICHTLIYRDHAHHSPFLWLHKHLIVLVYSTLYLIRVMPFSCLSPTLLVLYGISQYLSIKDQQKTQRISTSLTGTSWEEQTRAIIRLSFYQDWCQTVSLGSCLISSVMQIMHAIRDGNITKTLFLGHKRSLAQFGLLWVNVFSPFHTHWSLQEVMNKSNIWNATHLSTLMNDTISYHVYYIHYYRVWNYDYEICQWSTWPLHHVSIV